MQPTDWITLGIAIWGALLSTGLAIYQFSKDRRSIIVYLEYAFFAEMARLTVVNIGHRPVTITTVNLSTRFGDGWRVVPEGHVFEIEGRRQEPDPPLPRTLTDGEFLTYFLHEVVSEEMRKGEGRVRVVIYDADGNKYSKFRRRNYNAKMGTYSKASEWKR